LSLDFHGVAARLRRSLLVAALFTLALVAPTSAQAADNLGAGGVKAPGSALVVGVSGASSQAGKISARFSAVNAPLFWGADTSNMNDGTAAVFALNTPSGLYSAQAYGQDNSPFTQTSAPVLTGTGTVGDPYVVTSQFDATGSIHITQAVTHVSGTTQFKATWAITNGSGGATAMQAFEGADMYVNGNDNGDGTISGSSPNRVVGSVASDGTQGQLVEQAASPWTHYFSGMNSQFYDSTGDSTFGSLSDTVDPTNQDSGQGVEWDFVVGSGATKTVSVVWNFTHPALPQAPRITSGAPAASAVTSSTSADPVFAPAVGDSSNAIAFQCALDGGSFTACVSPEALSSLSEGSHTFSVRALNSAGDPGPQTDRTWTVDTTAPGAPALGGAPSGLVNVDQASITLSGESGATFRCSVDGGSYVGCTSPLVLTGLADGNHTVSVKQVDAATNAGTLVDTANWSVDTIAPGAPGLTGAPTGTVVTTEASITLNGELDATFRCSLDGGSYGPCSNPLVLTGLADGNHTVSVKQVDAAGNPSTLVGTASWAVDASVPVATEVAEPADTTATTSEVAFETTPGMTAECSLDGGAFQACSSPLAVSGLAVGQHTVKVRMVNAMGTPGAASVVTWTVSAPVVEAPAKTATTTTTTATPAAPATTTIVPAACISRRAVNVHWTMPGSAKAKAFKVLVNGKVVKTLSGKARAYRVSLAGRGAASVKVQVKAVIASGRAFATTRVYKTCATKAGDPSVPTVVLKSVKA
jgi:hypothetical protein